MMEAIVSQTPYKILEDGHVTSAKGFTAGGTHTGIRKSKLDFGWIHSDVPATAAGVFTLNSFQAAPLKVTKANIAVEQKLQTVIVNSGNANSCTGDQGMEDAFEMAQLTAKEKGIKDHYVGVASTGIIGIPLPMDKIRIGISAINDKASQYPEYFENAILTTDIVTKHLAVEVEIDGKNITIGGAAKGSGMIHPNMATMLGFVTTDAAIETESLQHALKAATNQTFNMITVDGDSSTNDTVLVLANGRQENNPLNPNHPQWKKFTTAFHYVCQQLAKSIARDGEGAKKLLEVEVKGAKTETAAKEIAKTVISSNLVKTAIYGSDANWGRIVTAVGYSGQAIDPDKVSVSIGPITVFEKGLGLLYNEEEATHYLLGDDIKLIINLNQGTEKATAWGCDLTYDYIRINASYRT